MLFVDGSRASLFHSLEQPALAPLPTERFDMSQWSRATVNIDYHVAFDGNFYSVPYTLVQQIVEVRSTPTTVEIFYKGTRILSHLRSRGRGQTITQGEHRPKSHQAHLEWPPSRMVMAVRESLRSTPGAPLSAEAAQRAGANERGVHR